MVEVSAVAEVSVVASEEDVGDLEEIDITANFRLSNIVLLKFVAFNCCQKEIIVFQNFQVTKW